MYTTAPQEHLAQFCQRNDIRVVNLCEDFRALARRVYPLYYDVDGHWRPAGHELVAAVLYRSLAPYVRDHDARVPAVVAEPRAERR